MIHISNAKWVGRFKWLGIFVATLLFVLLAVSPTKITRAENERVITVYHDGIEQTIVTDAKTVSDALQRAKVQVNQNDTVEPKTDTELTAPSYSVNVYRARPVIVVDGNLRTTVMTSHTSAREIAAAAGLTLYDEDTYTLTRVDDFLSEGGMGLKLTIDRAMPVNLVLYGKTSSIRTQADTIKDLLKEKNINLEQQDGTNLPVDTAIKNGITVEVWRNGVQTATNEEPVAFTTRQVRDNDKPSGYKAIQTPGENGTKMVTYQIETKDGKEVSRKLIQSVITKEAKEQIEVIGKAGFTGAFSEALTKLRVCEAGGNYANKNNATYRGAYQFSYSTWANYGGYYDPADAPAAVQDQAAYELYVRRGWQPWPACSAGMGLQDIYR